MTSRINNSDGSSSPRSSRSLALSQTLGNRLLAYVTMAGAGVAASASPAEAKVVYTPAHSFLNFDYHFDLNHDGIEDFFMSSYYFSLQGAVKVHPLVKGNRIVAAQTCYAYGDGAAALPAGALIGPTQSLKANAECLAAVFSFVTEGVWWHTNDAYLGLAFLIDGKTHFGWARVHVNRDFYFCGCIAAIDGYAYETVPGKPIVAGDTGSEDQASVEPGGLGALALGAPGIVSWRRERQ
ncbi:MAG TPA: hypothetical protein VND65_21625 [Candidatus Binatia bacterium]|nr:hypothetical protein [Candidatus Binatia bacterium]